MKILTVVAGALLLTAFAPSERYPLKFDGAEPSRLTETTSHFHCGGVTTKVAYRQERKDPDEVPSLRDALRASLADLSVSGRRIHPAGLDDARNLFRSYATIETVHVQCFQGDVNVQLRGMPLGPWIDFLEGRLDQRPSISNSTIRISKEGGVQILR